MSLRNKVSQLKDLVKSLDLNNEEDKNKIINGIIEVLDEFALQIEKLDTRQVRIQQQVNNIDEDLSALEEEIYEYRDEPIEISCPHCNEIITFSEHEIDEDGEVECPICNRTFEVEWECDCEDCEKDDK